MLSNKDTNGILAFMSIIVAAVIVIVAGSNAPATPSKPAPVVTKYTLYSKYFEKSRDVFVTKIDNTYTVTYQDRWHDITVEGFEDLGEALEEMAIMLEL